MPHPTFGKLEPKYSLLVNPHVSYRLSSCPHCNRPTHPRKFALLLQIDGYGPLVHGKTCKYCSKCGMILVQQDDLETELMLTAAKLSPKLFGRRYEILGVVELKVFKAVLAGSSSDLAETLKHTSDFKKRFGLVSSPGGRYPAGKEPPLLPDHRPQIIPRPEGQRPGSGR